MFFKNLTLAILILLLTLHCNDSSSKNDDAFQKAFLFAYLQRQLSLSSTGTSEYDNLATYYSTMTKMELQVVYEADAEPYTGSFTNPATSSTKTVWGILEDNLKEIFTNRGQSVSFTIPSTTANMQSITSQNKSSWTNSELTNFAKTYRKATSTADTGRFFVAFLNGYFSENGSTNQNVIGINITGTPYLFIFKPVITSISSGSPAVTNATRVYVEQSTLIHEMGHALGLVNNGVPLSSSHQDTSNGKHCSNSNCVMYYANTGTSALVTFLQTYLSSGSNIMLKSDCLTDIKNYK
jgi:predicted Zn-dependent protease